MYLNVFNHSNEATHYPAGSLDFVITFVYLLMAAAYIKAF